MAATVASLIHEAQGRIAASGSSSSRLDAEILFRHATGMDRTQLFLAMQDAATENTVTTFFTLVERRIAGEPIAYITGRREFMGLAFSVTPDVLIPRPETELLVEWALSWLGTIPEKPISIVDVGSGSGAIAVSIAALTTCPPRVLAIEPSAAARGVIAANASTLLDVDRRQRFSIASDDLLTRHLGPFSMVLANLPYLTPGQIAENPDLAAEPRMALDGGLDGLGLVKRLVHQLPGRLASTFAVGLEIDPSQSRKVTSLLQHLLPDASVSVISDLAGHDRHVVATCQDSMQGC